MSEPSPSKYQHTTAPPPLRIVGPSSFDLFTEALKTYTILKLSDELSLNKGTLKRWLLNKSVPKSYFNDINRLIKYKYPPLSTARDKDQFYTSDKITKYCYNKTIEVLDTLQINPKNYTFIEPSAGQCNFYKLLPKNKRIGIDIDPKGPNSAEIIKLNYLDYTPENPTGRYIVIGNPPFGLRGNLALRFINHSLPFADVVAFILPPLFDSTGKGVPKARVKGYKLAHTEKLPIDSFEYPSGKKVSVATVFQVWSKINTTRIKTHPVKTCKSVVKVYSLSDGGTPGSTRNKNMLHKCDIYLPSTCFSGMMAYTKFENLPNKRGYGLVFLKDKSKLKAMCLNDVNWQKASFASTNGAKNLRTDLIEQQFIKRRFFDK